MQTSYESVVKWLLNELRVTELEAKAFARIGHGTLSMKARSMAEAIRILAGKFAREFKGEN